MQDGFNRTQPVKTTSVQKLCKIKKKNWTHLCKKKPSAALNPEWPTLSGKHPRGDGGGENNSLAVSPSLLPSTLDNTPLPGHHQPHPHHCLPALLLLGLLQRCGAGRGGANDKQGPDAHGSGFFCKRWSPSAEKKKDCQQQAYPRVCHLFLKTV